jgi:predicted secreted Zn-dependent protease
MEVLGQVRNPAGKCVFARFRFAYCFEVVRPESVVSYKQPDRDPHSELAIRLYWEFFRNFFRQDEWKDVVDEISFTNGGLNIHVDPAHADRVRKAVLEQLGRLETEAQESLMRLPAQQR